MIGDYMNQLIKSIYNGFDVPPSDYIGRDSPDYNKYRENAFHAEQVVVVARQL